MRHKGQPILVVGGGPSAPRQLEMLPNVGHMTVISANGHAFKLGGCPRPSYIFCKDHINTETKKPMEPTVRPYGVPIVNCHYWADYRAPKWPIRGNSGMMAIGLAAFMGGCPVIPIGFDCFQGATYFHAPSVPNVSLGRKDGMWVARMRRLEGSLEGAVVRVLPGIMALAFKLFTEHERLPEPNTPSSLRHLTGEKRYVIRAKRPFHLPYDARAEIPAGGLMAVTMNELGRLSALGLVQEVLQ